MTQTVHDTGGHDSGGHDSDEIRAEARGGAEGYRPTATLTYATEMRRQLSRRRTQLTLGFMFVLPLIILIAFPIIALWLPSRM